MKNIRNKRLEKKSLTQLENNDWGVPKVDSYVAKTCHQLRYKPLEQLSTEDIRILIGQDIGLPFLMPIAIDFLKENPLAEGMHYPGDLLCAALQVNNIFLKDNPHYNNELIKILDAAIINIETMEKYAKNCLQKALEIALMKFNESHLG
jgi:hypothetical protein